MYRTMNVIQDTFRLLRSPRAALAAELAAPPLTSVFFLVQVTPLVTLRATAELTRSFLMGTPLVGFVLGLGSFVLQMGLWLGVSLVLPPLAQQFRTELSEPQAFVLSARSLTPLWLVGVTGIVPLSVPLVMLWSRGLVLVAVLYGLWILFQGFAALPARRSLQVPLTVATAAAALVLHTALFVVLGIGANVFIFLIS